MLVIIGTGLAGYSVAKEWRKLDKNQPLVLITQDEGHFYSKPLLSTALSQTKTPEALVITPVETMQQQLDATIYTHSSVCAINTEKQEITVLTPDGEITLLYSQCVMALGAKPKPFAPLANHKNHYRINSLQDYARFMADFHRFEKLSIIGSGLVGCEFAHDFSHKDIPIEIFTPDPYPLARFVPQPVGQALQQVLADKGITWHTDITCFDFQDNPNECILTAIGLQPNIEIANLAGVAVNIGIKVDRFLATNKANVFALGDCAEIEDKCYQFIAPIIHCAQRLAQTLIGNPMAIALPTMAITLKVGSYPIITCPPALNEIGTWEYEQKETCVKAVFYNQDRKVCGYSLTGSYREERQHYLSLMN